MKAIQHIQHLDPVNQVTQVEGRQDQHSQLQVNSQAGRHNHTHQEADTPINKIIRANSISSHSKFH